MGVDSMCTYPLCEILNKNTYGLHVLSLSRILHHLLHVFLHFGEVALRGENSDVQEVLGSHVFEVVWLDLLSLLKTFFLSLLSVSQKEWGLDHVKDIKIGVHVFIKKF